MSDVRHLFRMSPVCLCLPKALHRSRYARRDRRVSEPVKIKICGIRGREALDASIAGGADFVGFVHWSGSPRHVTISDAEALAAHLPENIDPVGLFVDAALEDMLSCPFQWIQLHGQEDESMCRSLTDGGKRIIRGIHFSPNNIRRWQDCDAVERLLVDGSKVGGTGEGFDHEQLSEHLRPDARPILLAGGLTPENANAQAASSVDHVRAMLDGVVPAGAVNADRASRLREFFAG